MTAPKPSLPHDSALLHVTGTARYIDDEAEPADLLHLAFGQSTETHAAITGIVAAVRSTGAVVYWVGLPVMRDPQLDADMQAMDAFYEDHMRRLGVPFVDSRPLTLDAKGKYNAYLPDLKTGKPVLLRTGDGLHMIGVGYQRLTNGVAADLRRYAGRVRQAAGRPAPGGGTR